MMEARNITPNITPRQYADAVGVGMAEAQAEVQLAAAEVEAAYLKAVTNGWREVRQTLTVALIAYLNGEPLPPMTKWVKQKFNKNVKPYGDMLRAENLQ